MRSKWKILVVSGLLYKYFFLKRPTSCLFHLKGKFQFRNILIRNRLVQIKEYRNKFFNWRSQTSYQSRKFFFVNRTDYILPLYQGRRFWVSSGKRLVPISVDYNKIRTRFGMYCHTKRYSPIHRGTNFVFKGINRRGKFQPFFATRRRSKRGGSGRPIWDKMFKKSFKKASPANKKKLSISKKVKKR